MQSLKRLAPWMLLGPVTGLLAEGTLRSLRAGEFPLAALYATALFITSFDLAIFGGLLTS